MTMPILEVHDLKKYFAGKESPFALKKTNIRAVDDISFSVQEGETFGLVGESGCGKSTTARLILRLMEPTAGTIIFDGQDITRLKQTELSHVRKKAQMIFQDPYASLNPRMTLGEIIEEPLKIHKYGDKDFRQEKVFELLDMVGLSSYHAVRYPHEFSGGQRQRIGIARALAVDPKLVICDEPVSALDVSIQAQVLNLMQDLQQNLKLTYIFIAHDLSVVKHISDRIGVMYLGRLMEVATKNELINNPAHPYTKALIGSIPTPNPRIRREMIPLKGEIPSPSSPPSGCSFHPRCIHSMDKCKKIRPELKAIGADHFMACYLAD